MDMTQNLNCPNCGNNQSFEKKRSFLGFNECICLICKEKFINPNQPLGNAYRIGYGIIAIWMAAGFYNISEVNIKLYGVQSYVFFAVVLFGSVRALWIDFAIRKNSSRKEITRD